MFMEKRNKLFLIVGLMTLIPGAHAGVILAPPVPPPVMTGPEESFPESKFGAPPARLGRRDDQAAANTNGDAFDRASLRVNTGNRAPAGLEFSSDTQNTASRTNESSFSGGEVSNRSSRGIESLTNVRRGVQEVSLIAGDLGFFPKVIFATRDVPVRLYVTGASKNTLCLMMDSFQVRRQVRGGKIEEISFTAGNSGKYRFYCPINGMEGHVVVREPSVAETFDRATASQAAPQRGQEE